MLSIFKKKKKEEPNFSYVVNNYSKVVKEKIYFSQPTKKQNVAPDWAKYVISVSVANNIGEGKDFIVEYCEEKVPKYQKTYIDKDYINRFYLMEPKTNYTTYIKFFKEDMGVGEATKEILKNLVIIDTSSKA